MPRGRPQCRYPQAEGVGEDEGEGEGAAAADGDGAAEGEAEAGPSVAAGEAEPRRYVLPRRSELQEQQREQQQRRREQQEQQEQQEQRQEQRPPPADSSHCMICACDDVELRTPTGWSGLATAAADGNAAVRGKATVEKARARMCRCATCLVCRMCLVEWHRQQRYDACPLCHGRCGRPMPAVRRISVTGAQLMRAEQRFFSQPSLGVASRPQSPVGML